MPPGVVAELVEVVVVPSLVASRVPIARGAGPAPPEASLLFIVGLLPRVAAGDGVSSFSITAALVCAHTVGMNR